MTFAALLKMFGAGFALARLDELRAAAAGVSTTKAQRKQLASRIDDARTRGRAVKVANLILLGLLTDRDYWTEWIRRSSVLRPSGYDLNTSTLRKLLPLIHQISQATALPSEFTSFLEHIDWLMVLAEAAHKKRIAILKLIAKDRLLVKSCLITTELLFIGKTDYLIKQDLPLSPEDAAGALSYLIYLVQRRSGPPGISLGAIGSTKVRNGYYLSILEEVKRITDYFTWELLVFHFGYSCSLSPDRSAILLNSSSTAFAKSMRSGFIRQEMQNLAFVLGLKRELVSLAEVSAKFASFMEKQQLIRRMNSPDRWIFAIPVIPILTEFFSQDALFREEFAGLMLLCYDLLSSVEDAVSFKVDGVSIMDLMKAQRLMYVIHRVRVEKLKKIWKSDTDAALQSIAAVYQDESLLNFLQYSLPLESAKKILSLLEWNPKEKTYLDIMYQPVIRAADKNILVAPALFSVSNLPRNFLQLTQKRLGEKGDGLLAQRLRDELLKQGFVAWDDIGYRYRVEGDCDVVALHGSYLFIFECKNSLHPCSTAELRTSFDYLVKAQTQLEKFSTLWNDPGFRKYLSKRLKTDLSAVKTVVTAIITGNRMFGGLQLGASKVLGFHEIVNFIRAGRIVILNKEIVGRESGPLTPQQLRDFVTDAPWEQPLLAAMNRRDRVTRYGQIDVRVEDYSLKMIDLAHEWKIELSDELKNLFAEELGSSAQLD
ncbi:MAG: hypothetical protein ACRD72_04325 [Candidatus Angelobacter sp.]